MARDTEDWSGTDPGCEHAWVLPDLVVHLVRHAKAGSRSRWTGDDSVRPLSGKGVVQAEILADRLAPVGIGRLLTSPALRCQQTLEPLADRTGLPLEDAPALTEGEPLAPAVELLNGLSVNSALCAHGDLIPMMLDYLASVGAQLDSPPSCQKAGDWTLVREKGRFVTARYTPAP